MEQYKQGGEWGVTTNAVVIKIMIINLAHFATITIAAQATSTTIAQKDRPTRERERSANAVVEMATCNLPALQSHLETTTDYAHRMPSCSHLGPKLMLKMSRSLRHSVEHFLGHGCQAIILVKIMSATLLAMVVNITQSRAIVLVKIMSKTSRSLRPSFDYFLLARPAAGQ